MAAKIGDLLTLKEMDRLCMHAEALKSIECTTISLNVDNWTYLMNLMSDNYFK